MDYVYLVYYSESNYYEMPSFVRVFSDKSKALEFIENHPDLDWEEIAADI